MKQKSMTRHFLVPSESAWAHCVQTLIRTLRVLPLPVSVSDAKTASQQSPLPDLPHIYLGLFISTDVLSESVGGWGRPPARGGTWSWTGKGRWSCGWLPAKSWSFCSHSRGTTLPGASPNSSYPHRLPSAFLPTLLSLSPVSWPVSRAGTPIGWREEAPRRGPQPFNRTLKRACLKMPGRLFASGSLGGILVFACARVELGCTQGRCLEPVGQDSQNECRGREPRTPADQTLLSMKEGCTLQPGRGPVLPPEPPSKV